MHLQYTCTNTNGLACLLADNPANRSSQGQVPLRRAIPTEAITHRMALYCLHPGPHLEPLSPGIATPAGHPRSSPPLKQPLVHRYYRSLSSPSSAALPAPMPAALARSVPHAPTVASSASLDPGIPRSIRLPRLLSGRPMSSEADGALLRPEMGTAQPTLSWCPDNYGSRRLA